MNLPSPVVTAAVTVSERKILNCEFLHFPKSMEKMNSLISVINSVAFVKIKQGPC